MQKVKIAPWIGGDRNEFHTRVHTTSWIHREFKIETDEQLNKRIKKFCQEHLNRFKNKTVAIVAHGGIIGMMLLYFGVSLEFVKGKSIKNTEIFVLEKEKDGYQLGNLGNLGNKGVKRDKGDKRKEE